MQIEITEIDYIGFKYKADCLDLPGMPPIGYGDTEDKAIISLLLILLHARYDNLSGAIEVIYR